MDSNSLRRAFTDFFVERGHTAVPSSGVIPHHPTAPLFTNAGMNQFVPYFLEEERAPWPRATSIQKCIRLSGKHNDVDEIGKTRRHMSFFQMLGNFSFGDYFKEDAIKMAWELLTEVVGFDGDRLWMTVHTSDDEAEAIWHEVVGVPMDRIQRLGDKENFWDMGPTGPCGPCSEIHFDCGPEWGDAGGPEAGDSDRYIEFWNLVFMQNQYGEHGEILDLPRKNIDTGGGIERWLMLLENVETVFDTDELRRIIEEAERLTGARYKSDDATTFALRVLADHARTIPILIEGGVVPSNEERGYICRSVVRRAVRRAYQLGVDKVVLPDLVGAAIDISGDAFPELVRHKDTILGTVEREEVRFRRTLRDGSVVLDEEIATGRIRGDVAFQLHDTFGFPIEITAEVAEERGVELDRAGFDERMAEQRRRAKEGRKVVAAGGKDTTAYKAIVDASSTTVFTGYDETESEATVVAVFDNEDGTVEVFLDRTPFYAESGGQIGDTGTIETASGVLRVSDTTAALPGLFRHIGKLEGDIEEGQRAIAAIDVERRDAIRRNHTATHLLHWALREVLGDHVKQQGSRVGPDELRFDFSHHGPLTADEIAQVEHMVNAEVLLNPDVGSGEYSKDEAETMGAIAFFGDKYGDRVRVIQAGGKSIEFCGGTHVSALGTIGTIKITSEESIGANMRRIFAVTGWGTIAWMNERDRLVHDAAAMLKAAPEELTSAVTRTLERNKALEAELRNLKAASARAEGPALAAEAVNGVVVARRDGLPQDALRDLALAVRDQPNIKAVVLGGSPEDGKVALVAVVSKQGRDAGLDAGAILADAAKAVQGGGSKNPDMSMAGGRNVAGIDDALKLAAKAAGAE
ncbi:MAG: alanyl-tRNA synthetase [Actinomycetota bacterium]|jgi:alanyl-tRNA synthetase